MDSISDFVAKKSPQTVKPRCEQFVGEDIGMTRATMDQRRREQCVLLREKKMKIQHLKKRCEEIAADVKNQFDQLTEKLLHYQGEPNWLIECFSVIFNESSANVIEYEKEIKQLYKEVAELKQAVHRKIEKQKNGPSVSYVQKVPTVSKSNVQEAEGQPTVSGIPVHTNPFEVLDHEIHLAHEEISVTSDSDEEEVFILLDPRRHKTECSVSSLDDRQDISDVGLSVNSNVHYESAYENRDQNCPSPSSNQMDGSIPESSKTEIPQTMGRSEWKPREPPTFSGRLKEDVHQWTTIVNQYFTLVSGNN